MEVQVIFGIAFVFICVVIYFHIKATQKAFNNIEVGDTIASGRALMFPDDPVCMADNGDFTEVTAVNKDAEGNTMSIVCANGTTYTAKDYRHGDFRRIGD